jgi:hypothetical protein
MTVTYRCGKTQLIKYACEYWNMRHVILDCHGGTTIADIMQIFTVAENLLASMPRGSRVCVFLDEINTTINIGLIAEAIMSHTLHGVRINDDIVILGALNPYRFKPIVRVVDGLSFDPVMATSPASPIQAKLSTSWLWVPARSTASPESKPRPQPVTATVVPLRSRANNKVAPKVETTLVYKVQPIPDTLLSYVLDFGALQVTSEDLYITAMIKHQLGQMVNSKDAERLCRLMSVAQLFVREYEKDPSAVSLRDVKRCLKLIRWFQSINPFCGLRQQFVKPEDVAALGEWRGTISPRPYVLGLAMVYYYRLGTREARSEFWTQISAAAIGGGWNLSVGLVGSIIGCEEDLYCSHITFADGIAKNEAVRENLFVTITCVSNKIPLILVGKPGSSKTLTLQVIASNLNGLNSANPFWKRFPSVSTFSYQCSPLSTAAGIEAQYRRACGYQDTQTRAQATVNNEFTRHMESKMRTTTVLLLDEIGLAEHSPDQPLKVLHKILPDEEISIVGISNWVLDPAKMNRAILLNRPDPTPADLEYTGQAISNIDNSFGLSADKSKLGQKLMSSVAYAFNDVYQAQSGRPFFSMRDFYSLLKHIRRHEGSLDWAVVLEGLCRNFGGKHEFLERVILVFMTHYQPEATSYFRLFATPAKPLTKTPAPVLKMITDNLKESEVRHLMLITRDDNALSIIRHLGLLGNDPEILIGSNFVDDQNDHSLVISVNRVKDCMARGRTVVLLRQNRIYEALYDVLNLRTVLKKLKSGKSEAMLRLAIGASSQLCPVDSKFKLIVIVNREEAYERLDVPLLSRFEKQWMTAPDAIEPNSGLARLVTELQDWLNAVMTDTQLVAPDVIAGFREYTLGSFVLTTSGHDAFTAKSAVGNVSQLIDQLRSCLSPLAVHRCAALRRAYPAYFQIHDSLSAVICNRLSDFCGANCKPLANTSSAMNDVSSNDQISLTCVRTNNGTTTLLHALPQISADVVHQMGGNQVLHIHEIIQVSHIKSERDFRDRVSSLLFSGSVLVPSLLYIHCDALALDGSTIRHVKLICEQLRTLRMKWSMQDASHENLQRFQSAFPKQMATAMYVPVVPFHILLVITDPPRRNVPQFALEFSPNWKEYYCDDVRSQTAGGQFIPRIEDLLDLSTYQLCCNNQSYVEHVIRSHYRLALTSIHYRPDESQTEGQDGGSRLQMFARLLASEPEFCSLLVSGVSLVLKTVTSQVGCPRDHRKKLQRLVGKSLREHLMDALVSEIVFALALLVAILDRNYNLRLLEAPVSSETPRTSTVSPPSSNSYRSLWLNMATSQLDGVALWADWVQDYIVGSINFAKMHTNDTVDAFNDGVEQAIAARYPFSFSVIRFMKNPDTKKTVMYRADALPKNIAEDRSKVEEQIIHGMIALTFGDTFASLTENELCVRDYFSDYLSQEPSNYPGIAKTTQAYITDMLLVATHPRAFSSLGLLHSCYWKIDHEIRSVLSLLNCVQLYDEKMVRDIVDIIGRHFSTSSTRSDATITPLMVKIQEFIVCNLTISWASLLSIDQYLQFLSTLRPYLDMVRDRITEEGPAKHRVANLMDSFKFTVALLSEMPAELLVLVLGNSACKAALCNLIEMLQRTGLMSTRTICEAFITMGGVLDKVIAYNSGGSSNRKRNADIYAPAVFGQQKNLYLQLLFRRVVLDVVVPAIAVLCSSHKISAEMVLQIRQAVTTSKDLVGLLLQVACAEQESEGATLISVFGNPYPFLQRSIVQYLLSSPPTVRSALFRKIEGLFQVADDCLICYTEDLVEPVIVNCGKKFCRNCIQPWISTNACPNCRDPACKIAGPHQVKFSAQLFVDVVILCLNWDQDMASYYRDEEINVNVPQAQSPNILSQDEFAKAAILLSMDISDAVRSYGFETCLSIWRKVQFTTREFAQFVSTGILNGNSGRGSSPTVADAHPCILAKADPRQITPESYLYWPSVLALRSILKQCGQTSLYYYLTNPNSYPQLRDAPMIWIQRLPLRPLLKKPNFDVFLMFPDYGFAAQTMDSVFQIENLVLSETIPAALSNINFPTKVALILLCIARRCLSNIAEIGEMGYHEWVEVCKRALAILLNWVKPLHHGIQGIGNMIRGGAGDSLWKLNTVTNTTAPVQNNNSSSSINHASSNNTEPSLPVGEKVMAVIMSIFLNNAITVLTEASPSSAIATAGHEGSSKPVIGAGAGGAVSGGTGNRSISTVLKIAPNSLPAEVFRVQVLVHIVAAAVQFPSGWLWSLVADPVSLKEVFVPSMPNDELSQILAGLGRESAGAKTVYRCQCGYMYFIGNCGMANEKGQCPQCKLPIGAQAYHTIVSTSKKISEEELAEARSCKGYMRRCVTGATSISTGRDVSPLTTRLLRFFIHSCLFMGTAAATSDVDKGKAMNKLSTSICDFVNGAGESKSSADHLTLAACARFCEERLMEDWGELKQLLTVNDEALATLLHACITDGTALFCGTSAAINSAKLREIFEKAFQREVVENIFTRGSLADKVASIVTQVTGNSRAQTVILDEGQHTLRADLFEGIEETEHRVEDQAHRAKSRLWQHRMSVSYEDFVTKFQLNARNSRQFPLLDIIINQEDRLSVIAGISAILRWHAVLFEAFPDGALSRQQVTDITNMDVIQRLPEHRQPEARRSMYEYFDAFNASFPLLEYIYQCQENDKRTMRMDEQTSIAFSLPDYPTTAGVEATAGVSTVSLLQMLVNSHNNMLEALESSESGYKFSTAVPFTTQTGCDNVLQSKLLTYSRKDHLLPLLFAFARQGEGQGEELTYDYRAVSMALGTLLVAGKQKLGLHPRLYQFRGEIQSQGYLARMSALVPQVPMPPVVQRSVRAELSLNNEPTELMRIVETAIRFLATSANARTTTANTAGRRQTNSSSSSSAAVGVDRDAMSLDQMPLTTFVVDSLHIEEQMWLERTLGIPSLRSPQICLCHLADLNFLIEEIMGDGQFGRVDTRYKAPLDALGKDQLRQAIRSGLNAQQMAAFLRTVLADNLSNNIALSPSIPLRSGLLDYVDGVETVQGYEQYFPEMILLQHCHACYELLNSLS